MKGIVTILLLMVAGVHTKAQTLSTPLETFTLSAELMNGPGSIFYCGEVICEIELTFETHKTFSKNNQMSFHITCPLEAYGLGFFVKGKHYLLTVSKGVSILNPSSLSCWMPSAPTMFWYNLEKVVKLD